MSHVSEDPSRVTGDIKRPAVLDILALIFLPNPDQTGQSPPQTEDCCLHTRQHISLALYLRLWRCGLYDESTWPLLPVYLIARLVPSIHFLSHDYQYQLQLRSIQSWLEHIRKFTAMSFKMSPDAMDCPTPGAFFGPEATVSPRDMSLTPQSMATPHENFMTPTYTPEPEKKTTKKRKSWGQELPTPKTNLPPRYVCCDSRCEGSKEANLFLESVQRPKMRRNNVVLSVSSEIVRLLNLLVSASVRRLRSSKARRWASSSRISFS